MTNTFFKYCFLFFVLVNLTACGVLDSIVPKAVMDFVAPKGNKLAWSGISIRAAGDANLNSPVALDIVMLKDDASLNMVAGLSAAKWFATRAELAKTFPQGLTYRSIEVTPGQTLRLPASEFGSVRVSAAMIFADYLTPGEHRVRVDQMQGDVLVQLGAQAFTVVSQAAN